MFFNLVVDGKESTQVKVKIVVLHTSKVIHYVLLFNSITKAVKSALLVQQYYYITCQQTTHHGLPSAILESHEI